MRKILVAGIAAASLAAASLAAMSLCGASALAADLPAAAPVYKAAPAPVSNWTGFYVGANGGYGWKNIGVTETPGDPNTAIVFGGKINVPAATTSFDSKGWLGGVQAGYNWQFNQRWVAGVETDFDWSDLKGSGSTPTTVAFGATPASFNATQKIEWFGTLRARLGYLPTNNLLLYATGGLAYGKVNESANVVLPAGVSNSTGNFNFEYACGGFYGGPTCFSGSHSRTSTGWTAGAGAEYEFARNVTLKFEYLYVNLGSDSFASPAVIFFNNASFLRASFGDAAFNLVRLGVNYRF